MPDEEPFAPVENSGPDRRHTRIHIDRVHYESPNPTTGAALYDLGHVAAGKALYREVEGDHEDKLVRNEEREVHLKEDEHFYSAVPEFKIIVNGREKTANTPELAYAQVVALAFDTPAAGPNIMFTITYRRGPRENPEGSLLEGKSVEIKDGMIFNVTQTDKS